MGLPTEQDLADLQDWVRSRYEASGLAPDTVSALIRHNEKVLAFTECLCDDAQVSREERLLLRTIAILHDAAKAETPLLLHAQVAAELARKKLAEVDVDAEFADVVEGAILSHMGPLPFIEEEARKHTERTGEHLDIPAPKTRIEKLFYDADMLTLMDVSGVEKIVNLRCCTDQFIEEDERVAVEEETTPRAVAYSSALQSVHRAAATLFTPEARRLAQTLVEEAERHVCACAGEKALALLRR